MLILSSLTSWTLPNKGGICANPKIPLIFWITFQKTQKIAFV